METDTLTKPKKSSKKKESNSSPASVKKETKPKMDYAKSYNQFKVFNGEQYSGMKVGRSHKWYYDKGEWHEAKITPDLWEILMQ